MKAFWRAAASVGLAALFVLPAAAQDKYPSRSVKILVPYAPGGATDILARIIAQGMGKSLGQSFIVENKPGAFGILALEELARSKPDGYTLMVGNVTTNAITPMLYSKRMTFDYGSSIIPVTRLADLPAFLIATTKDFPPNSVAEFVAYAKQRPGQLKYATVGVGSFPHYDMLMFAKKAGIDMIAVPLKGGASEAVTTMAGGEEETSFLNVATTGPLIKAGNLKPLAVVADNRLKDYPNVPTMAEVGYPGIGTQQWQAVFARAGTPKPVVETIFKAASAAVLSPEAAKIFAPQYIRALPSKSPEEAASWLKSDTEAWRKTIAEANLKLE
jgi:tripartite-type tricarboxylate transporter receptor subunit TctC